jgi:hypothetical protein
VTIILGNLNGINDVDPSEAFIFKKDFTAIDRVTAEADRDAYYASNPSELTELDNNLNWFITLTYQDLGANLVVAQVRRSSIWADLGASSGIDFSELTDGEVAIYDQTSGKLLGRDIFVNEEGILTVGTNSISFGGAHKIASGYENIYLSNTFNHREYHPVWQDGSIDGDPTPSMRLYTTPLQNRVILVENGDDKSGSLSSPDYTANNAINTRIFAIYVESVNTIDNVYMTLTDITSGIEVYKQPLGLLTSGIEKRVVFQPPLDSLISTSAILRIRSTDGIVTLKADTTNTYPWIAFDYREWEDQPLGAEKQAFLVSTNDTLLISDNPLTPTTWTGLSSLTISNGLILDVPTGSLINNSGKTILSATGSVSMQPIKGGGGGAQTLRLWSETSFDGVTWLVNPNSLRVYQITDDGNSFTTSISFDQNWLNGQYLRFAMYATGGGSGTLTLTPTSDIVRGQNVEGFSAVWNLKED